MKQNLISKKQIVLICVFLTIFIVSTVFIFITPLSVKRTLNLTTVTSDGVTISFNVFEPVNGGNNKKAVIIGHGSRASKEMMNGYAIELAAAGFVAITFDFRGHGLSTGDRSSGSLTDDIQAIKNYLISRTDIDSNNLGYIGLSMGGVGQELIEVDPDFKCFVGTATWLYPDLRKGNSTNPLNVLMIQAQYDEIVELEGLRESVSNRTGIPLSDVNVNKLYGSFSNGNATKIYLDDNSNHIFGQWDTDFLREARNWVINTFPDVIQEDEYFYAHVRLIILVIQIVGGLGFFIVIVDPLSKLILQKDERKTHKLELENVSIKSLSIKAIIYSLVLAIPGILIMFIINLPLGLALFGFIISLLFGQAFALWILLWRVGKRNNLSFFGVVKEPFKDSRNNILRQILLGIVLSIILFLILYLSIGLHYFAMVPSITKVLWIPVYYIITLFVFLIYGLIFQLALQSKFDKSIKSLVVITFLNFAFIFLYLFVYMFILSLILGSFFYFGFMIPVSIPTFLLVSFVWALLYRKTGNIWAGIFTSTLVIVMLISTATQIETTMEFIMGFIF